MCLLAARSNLIWLLSPVRSFGSSTISDWTPVGPPSSKLSSVSYNRDICDWQIAEREGNCIIYNLLGQVLWLMLMIPGFTKLSRRLIVIWRQPRLLKTEPVSGSVVSALWLQQVHLCCLSTLISQYGLYPGPKTDSTKPYGKQPKIQSDEDLFLSFSYFG